MKKTSLFFIFISSFLVGCASQPQIPLALTTPTQSPLMQEEQQEVSELYQSWEGVPYQFGGASKKGIDCSAFMQVAMSTVYQLHLPRSTELQSKQGKYISEEKATFL